MTFVNEKGEFIAATLLQAITPEVDRRTNIYIETHGIPASAEEYALIRINIIQQIMKERIISQPFSTATFYTGDL